MLQWSLPPCVLLSLFAPAFLSKAACAENLALVVAPVTPCRALQLSEGTSSGPRLESSSLPLSNQLCLGFRSIHIGGSGPGEHHCQHHAAHGHQHHGPQHHHVSLGQEEQEHQHTVPHGWCPWWNDHTPATCLLPAATSRGRELRPHGGPRHHVVPDSAGPAGKAALSLGLHRWVKGWVDTAGCPHFLWHFVSVQPVLKTLRECAGRASASRSCVWCTLPVFACICSPWAHWLMCWWLILGLFCQERWQERKSTKLVLWSSWISVSDFF